MKTCSTCKLPKSLDEFGNNKRNKDGKQYWCKECQSKSDKKHYEKHYDAHLARRKEIKKRTRLAYVEIKKQCFCAKCKEKRFYLLDFHHIDPAVKSFTISERSYDVSSLSPLLKEIKKCIVLCANCHREFHYLEKLLKITLEEYLSRDYRDVA